MASFNLSENSCFISIYPPLPSYYTLVRKMSTQKLKKFVNRNKMG
nr:MAG TPA: hypothetical protein [Caudoviricetes sp.]DAU23987.1 MAG TPA: hypothetical protein [Caudoviricetes sp.]